MQWSESAPKSWSNFWKEILIDFDNSEDVLIFIDVDKVVLNKIYKFLTTGKVAISGPQENIDVVKGLEMLFPDLELSDPQRLIIEDTDSTDEETQETSETKRSKFCSYYSSIKDLFRQKSKLSSCKAGLG